MRHSRDRSTTSSISAGEVRGKRPTLRSPDLGRSARCDSGCDAVELFHYGWCSGSLLPGSAAGNDTSHSSCSRSSGSLHLIRQKAQRILCVVAADAAAFHRFVHPRAVGLAHFRRHQASKLVFSTLRDSPQLSAPSRRLQKGGCRICDAPSHHQPGNRRNTQNE